MANIMVIVHRWQPKTQRYQTQKFEVGQDNSTADRFFLDMIFNKAQQAIDPLMKPMIMRTQRVDRISIGEELSGPVITVYLSPIVERKYVEVQEGEKKKKYKASDVMCRCMHTVEHHAPEANLVGKKICLVPGCRCDDLVIVGTHGDVFKDEDSGQMDAFKAFAAEQKANRPAMSPELKAIVDDLSGAITPEQDAVIDNTEERCIECVKTECGLECECACHERNLND